MRNKSTKEQLELEDAKTRIKHQDVSDLTKKIIDSLSKEKIEYLKEVMKNSPLDNPKTYNIKDLEDEMLKQLGIEVCHSIDTDKNYSEEILDYILKKVKIPVKETDDSNLTPLKYLQREFRLHIIRMFSPKRIKTHFPDASSTIGLLKRFKKNKSEMNETEILNDMKFRVLCGKLSEEALNCVNANNTIGITIKDIYDLAIETMNCIKKTEPKTYITNTTDTIQHLISQCIKDMELENINADECTRTEKIKQIINNNMFYHQFLIKFKDKGYQGISECIKTFTNLDLIDLNLLISLVPIMSSCANYCKVYHEKYQNETSKVFFETEFCKNTESYVNGIIKDEIPYFDHYLDIINDIIGFDNNSEYSSKFLNCPKFDFLCSDLRFKIDMEDYGQHERCLIWNIRKTYIDYYHNLSLIEFCGRLGKDFTEDEYDDADDWLEEIINGDDTDDDRKPVTLNEPNPDDREKLIETYINIPNPYEEDIEKIEDDLESGIYEHYEEICNKFKYDGDNYPVRKWNHWSCQVIRKAIDVYCNDFSISLSEFIKDLGILDEDNEDEGDIQEFWRIFHEQEDIYPIN